MSLTAPSATCFSTRFAQPARVTALVIAVVAAASCKVYDESMLLPEAGASCPAPAGAVSDGVGWWSGCDESGRCFSARAPTQADRPAATAGGADLTLTFGIRSMRLGSRDLAGKLDDKAWTTIGFDLDGLCTSSPTCAAEGEPPMSCRVQGTQYPVDGTWCRDNTFGRLEYMVERETEVGNRFRLDESFFNCSICQGAYNFLFRISSYNGLRDDNLVRVDIYPSPGLTAPRAVDCSGTEWKATDCWTPDDVWTVQSSYVTSGEPGPNVGESRMYDPAAFVRDGVVHVALPENTQLWFPGMDAAARAFPMVLQRGVVGVRIEKSDAGAWSLQDGIIAGRMKWTDAIDGFRKLGLCEGDPLFEGVKVFARTSADLLYNGETLPDAPCDAISVGMAFTADEAKIGPLREVPELVPCADAGVADAAPEAAADASVDAPVDAAVDAAKDSASADAGDASDGQAAGDL